MKEYYTRAVQTPSFLAFTEFNLFSKNENLPSYYLFTFHSLKNRIIKAKRHNLQRIEDLQVVPFHLTSAATDLE
ncbi:MAG TPA: hypothetical protein VFF80_04040 [Bacillota bacterium]|nr:hypothetical protein [Bacillota bacterium]